MNAPHAVEAIAIQQARRHAQAQFDASGMPTRRMESWRLGNLKLLTERSASPSGSGTADVGELADFLVRLDDLGTDRLVFIDGLLAPDHSRLSPQPDGVTLLSFAEWARREPEQAAETLTGEAGADQAFSNLNTARFQDGIVLVVPDNTRLATPLAVVHWNSGGSGSASYSRAHVTLGKNAAADIVEIWAGPGSGWSNDVARFTIGERAHLRLYKLQDEAGTAIHTAARDFLLQESAECETFTLTLGSAVSREQNLARLLGASGKLGIHGGYLLGDRQEATMATTISHEAPGCETHEVYKGVLADRAHGIFQGKIAVAKPAQKTDARQLNKTILLGDRAVMDTKPELEIYADDVKCAHGASVGDLDETALFYLRSRGLDLETARRMLVEAFVSEAIDLINLEPVRSLFSGRLAERLSLIAKEA